jgi:hypothetical protein
VCIHKWLTLYADRKGTKVQCVRCSEVRRWTFMRMKKPQVKLTELSIIHLNTSKLNFFEPHTEQDPDGSGLRG